MGIVTVYLDKISKLQDDDSMGKSDPYVVFRLEQDNYIFDKGYGKIVSSKKKNDLNREYGETFEFPKVPTLKTLVLYAGCWTTTLASTMCSDLATSIWRS
jgi:hypothetical protein